MSSEASNQLGEKFLVAHPDDVAPADQIASELDLPLILNSIVRPGVGYVIDPSALPEIRDPFR